MNLCTIPSSQFRTISILWDKGRVIDRDCYCNIGPMAFFCFCAFFSCSKGIPPLMDEDPRYFHFFYSPPSAILRHSAASAVGRSAWLVDTATAVRAFSCALSHGYFTKNEDLHTPIGGIAVSVLLSAASSYCRILDYPSFFVLVITCNTYWVFLVVASA